MFATPEVQAKDAVDACSVSIIVERVVRVLVADDSSAVLLATADLVGDYAGVQVVCLARDVDEAVRLSRTHQPDLALVDAWLKGGGAEIAAAKITTVSPKTTVAVIASSREPYLSDRLRTAGILGCFEKQMLNDLLPELLEAVRSPK